MDELGLALSSRAGLPPADFARYAAEAESAGFSAVFSTETSSDALALAQSMVLATRRARVGTAVANLHWRHPVLLALTAATVADASKGRFVLGLGVANPDLNERVLGLPRRSPLATVEEYVSIVRQVLQQPRVTHRGDVYTVEDFAPARRPDHAVPVYLAALQPRMMALAGRIADGVMLHLSSPHSAKASAEVVREAAEGRDGAAVEVCCLLPCCPSDDPAQAGEAARETVLRYALHPAANRVFARSGWAGELAAVASFLRAGDRDAARDSVSEELARAFVVHGDAHTCREQVERYRAAGIDMPILLPMPDANGDWERVIRTTIDTFSPHRQFAPEARHDEPASRPRRRTS